MIHKLYSKILILVTAAMCVGLLAPALASADCANPSSTKESIQCGTSNSAGVPVSSDATGSLNNTISTAVNILSAAVGVAAVIMLILGGFRYITGGGKQESIASAKNTVLYVIIGLTIAAFAQLIVHFVLRKSVVASSSYLVFSTRGWQAWLLPN
jgi:Type IV secretion system pilin